MTDLAENRKKFEQWVTPQFTYTVPCMRKIDPAFGDYAHYEVERLWTCWKAAYQAGLKEAPRKGYDDIPCSECGKPFGPDTECPTCKVLRGLDELQSNWAMEAAREIIEHINSARSGFLFGMAWENSTAAIIQKHSEVGERMASQPQPEKT